MSASAEPASSPADVEPAIIWTALFDGPFPAARNMARDHALALSLPPDSAVLRLYSWDRPTLSLGRNEPARGRYDEEALAAQGIGLVRRPTGGRAVLHWREITYAVVMPVRALGGPRSIYRWVNNRIARALASLGVATEIASSPAREAPLSAGPCFAAPAGGELTARGRKLVGSAQLRVGGALLQHGSILLADDQERLTSIFAGDVAGPARPVTVSELLKRNPEEGELERALLASFGLEAECTADVPSASSLESELEELYRSAAWTWRR